MRKLPWMVGVLLLTAAPPSMATMLCQKKSGALFVRTTCKKKETAVDPVALGLQGPKGDPGTSGTPGTPGQPGAPATRLWASVQNLNTGVPTLLDGAGVTAVSHNFTGGTTVTFNQDVSHCSFQATLVAPGGGYYTPPNEISVFTGFYVGSGLTNHQAVVATVHSSTPTDGYNFAIAAFC